MSSRFVFLILISTCGCEVGKELDKGSAYFQILRDSINENPGHVLDGILDGLTQFQFISERTVPSIKSAAMPYINDPDAKKGAITLVDKLEGWIPEDDRQAIYDAVDEMMTSEDQTSLDKAKTILQSKFDSFARLFLNRLSDETASKLVFDLLSTYILQGYDFFQSVMDDTMRLTIANSLLMSKDFPPINKYDQMKSSAAVLQKAIALFTSYTEEEMPIDSLMNDWVQEFEHHHFKLEDFHRHLTPEKRQQVLTAALIDTFVEPLLDLADLYEHHRNDESECRLLSLCLFNENYAYAVPKKEPSERDHAKRINRLQATAAEILSYLLISGLTPGLTEAEVDALHEAARAGHSRSVADLTCRKQFGDLDCPLRSSANRVPFDHHSEL